MPMVLVVARPQVTVARRVTVVCAALLCSLVAAIALPASARAAILTVNDSGDDGDVAADGLCLTVAGTCTFRAAVEEANRTSIVPDQIGFAPAVTETVTTGSALTVSSPVTIDGCSGDVDHAGPCVQASFAFGSSPSPPAGLEIAANDVTVAGLAVLAANGVHFADGFHGMQLRNNWFGVKLDGQLYRTDFTAVMIEGDGATVGGQSGATGSAPADRNVFADVKQAIRIVGADDTTVEGNRFGRTPSGAPGNSGASAIEVSRGPDGDIPEGTVIGGEATGTALATPECDGPCNVITRNFRGVDLDTGQFGSGPAGETTVAGNFLELSPDGLTADGGGNCVRVGRATPVVVGGPADGERNRFGWCGVGVNAAEPKELAVVNNSFGLKPDGAPLEHTSYLAAVDLSGDLSTTLVADNEIAGMGSPGSGNMPGYGVLLQGDGATLVGNEIGLEPGSSTPRFYHSPLHIEGSDNVVGTGAAEDGNVVRNGKEGGVVIADGTDNVVVGNRVEANSGPGITVERATATEVEGNYLGRNEGVRNTGPFIDLIPHAGPGVDPDDGPNGGSEPPALLGGRAGHVAGVAEPGAEVLLYGRAETGGVGDAEQLLGESTAGEDGRFTISFEAATPPARVVGMQTTGDGSSELSGPLALASAADTTPPETTTSGPEQYTNETTPAFGVFSTEAAKYLCRLDGGPWSHCRSAEVAPKLEEGEHKFEAIAVDLAGNSDPTPATRSFTVDTTPPDTTILSHDEPIYEGTNVTLRFTASEPAPAYACRLDEERYACGPTTTISRTAGRHIFQVAAKDRAGNVDPTPATLELDVRARPRIPITVPRPAPTPSPRPVDSRAVIEADLRRIARSLRQLRIRGLLRRRRGLRVSGLLAPAAGRLRLVASSRARVNGRVRRVRVLDSRTRAHAHGLVALRLNLDRAATRFLRRASSRLELSLQLTFTDGRGTTTTAAWKLRWHR